MKTLLLPPSLLLLLHLALPALSHASPQPALVTSDWEISLVPRNTLFLRQLTDLQSFDGALGGIKASPITNSGNQQRIFSVDGSTFPDFASAGQRSCDDQNKGCSDAANASGNKGDLTVRACDVQRTTCYTAQQNAPVKDFVSAMSSMNIGPDPEFPDYDLICEA